MADGTGPMDVSSSDPCVFRPDLSPHSILELAYNAGFTKHFVIIINSISGIIPRSYPIKLKKELAASVSNPKLIESLTDQANMLVSMFTACSSPAGLVPLSSSSPRSDDIPKDSDRSKSPDRKKHASD
ncbi:hypothetical protein JTE90_002740 [Oedothorax gibbosus]|uniref:Uncharacterized protein n=1 Tax=Oedothorax gibbosus TaxID=931172 RepID=A0AAV6VY72_9ARAC|nr:hypothetical protein JTE90_002740 [Oedothorax gibbosus]